MHLFDSIIASILKFKYKKVTAMLANPVGCQEKLMHSFVEEAKHTAFGKDHDFDNIRSYEDFKARVPLRNYEQLLPYIERIKAGEKDILWKGRPISLC